MAYNNLGVLPQEIGRINDAINAYENYISLNPGQVEAGKNLGNIFLSQGRLDEADACFAVPAACGQFFIVRKNLYPKILSESGTCDFFADFSGKFFLDKAVVRL
jgi:tetratricopeptide (TPR) repeat protein